MKVKAFIVDDKSWRLLYLAILIGISRGFHNYLSHTVLSRWQDISTIFCSIEAVSGGKVKAQKKRNTYRHLGKIKMQRKKAKKIIWHNKRHTERQPISDCFAMEAVTHSRRSEKTCHQFDSCVSPPRPAYTHLKSDLKFLLVVSFCSTLNYSGMSGCDDEYLRMRAWQRLLFRHD